MSSSGALIAFISSCGLALLLQSRRKSSSDSATSSKKKYGHEEKDDYLTPPLPAAVVTLLQASRLCFLATQSDGEPHLSLMNFSYLQEEELLVFCTRRNTKKFDQIVDCPNVSVLVHDFPHLAKVEGSSHGKSYSITLNGKALALAREHPEQERYRSLHLAKNSDYRQFIVGADIAVVLVKVNRARLCNIRDEVTQWNGTRQGEV